VPTEGQIAAVSALVILATVIVIAGLVSWAFA
jgi:hypothetical protein